MKKFVISIAAICAALFFVACGDSDGTETAYGVEDNAEEDGQKEENGNKEDGGNGGSTNTDNEQPDSDENTDTEDSNNDEDADTGDNSSDEDTADTADSGEKDCDPNPLYEKFIGRWAAEIILHSVSTASGIEAPSITTRYMLVDFYVNDKCQLDMNKVDNRLCRTDNRTGTDKNLPRQTHQDR